jgi:hypothetical protein
MTGLVPKIADPAKGDNDMPMIKLRPVGDGRAFCRALARIFVRRELISAGLIADPDRCEPEALAG